MINNLGKKNFLHNPSGIVDRHVGVCLVVCMSGGDCTPHISTCPNPYTLIHLYVPQVCMPPYVCMPPVHLYTTQYICTPHVCTPLCMSPVIQGTSGDYISLYRLYNCMPVIKLISIIVGHRQCTVLFLVTPHNVHTSTMLYTN